jgi:hypothetical protein
MRRVSFPLKPQFPFSCWGACFFGVLCDGCIKVRRPYGTVSDLASGIAPRVDMQVPGDGSLYSLSRGSSSATGVVTRFAYTPATPKIDLTANGSDGPVLLSPSDLQIDIPFVAGGTGMRGCRRRQRVLV